MREALDLKARIRHHYDVAAPLYRKLWGLHVHHGYWLDGSESKEAAQEQLVETLAQRAGIVRASRILDVGCGFGASAKYLAEHFGARVVGINFSDKQIETARAITAACEPCPKFIVADAECFELTEDFDVVWSIEAMSHLSNKRACFERLLKRLLPNGRIAIVDWFAGDGLNPEARRRYIEPIMEHMLLPELSTIDSYAELLQELGCGILTIEDISAHVAKTWDLCLQFTSLPFVWTFALSHGSDFVSFLKGFAAMRTGFASGAFRCGMLTAEKSRV